MDSPLSYELSIVDEIALNVLAGSGALEILADALFLLAKSYRFR